MRMRVSSAATQSSFRLCVALLLAGAATGCSSDVSRFGGGLFSRSDTITTSSIPGRNIGGTVPVPREDVAGGSQSATIMPPPTGRDAALNQPYPQPMGQNASYDPVNTASTSMSGARLASTPMSVQRTALADPAMPSQKPLAQPFPESPRADAPRQADVLTVPQADPIVTGTKGKAGWSTANAPTVTVRNGDTVAVLSKRFGVPEKEILKANGMSSRTVTPGQRIVIPTYGVATSAAKASASDAAADLDIDRQKPVPLPAGAREVAILPGQPQSRDKGQKTANLDAGNAASADKNETGSYVVKPGDSLNKVAKLNGVSVDALKQANGLTNASIRIGQSLKIPAGGTSVQPDKIVTATVPTKASAPTKAGQPEAYKPPVATKTVTEVASAAPDTDPSLKATGITKYRWPVRGAVTAGYGANVDGNRNDGINISVPEGTPIKAAENGVVIYAGSSLKELGNAVLVRHEDGKVTVYGNASALNVQRGQKVQRGQTLAASGMTGKATQPQVHFEVRKDATAVNPVTFLE